jgi:hypothetical protein
VQVNDDATTRSQFLPWCDLDDSSGNLSVIFYDARDDANNKKVHVYHALSTNGGASFGANTKVTDNPSDNSTDNASRYLAPPSTSVWRSRVVWPTRCDDNSATRPIRLPFDFIPPRAPPADRRPE